MRSKSTSLTRRVVTGILLLLMTLASAIQASQPGNPQQIIYVLSALEDDQMNASILADVIARKLQGLRVKRSDKPYAALYECPSNPCRNCPCDIIAVLKEQQRYVLAIRCCDPDLGGDPQLIPLSLPDRTPLAYVREKLAEKVQVMINSHNSQHQNKRNQ